MSFLDTNPPKVSYINETELLNSSTNPIFHSNILRTMLFARVKFKLFLNLRKQELYSQLQECFKQWE